MSRKKLECIPLPRREEVDLLRVISPQGHSIPLAHIYKYDKKKVLVWLVEVTDINREAIWGQLGHRDKEEVVSCDYQVPCGDGDVVWSVEFRNSDGYTVMGWFFKSFFKAKEFAYSRAWSMADDFQIAREEVIIKGDTISHSEFSCRWVITPERVW